jgi:hypothetical protein
VFSEEIHMRKISIVAMMILLLAGSSAWAQLALGGTGAVFTNMDQSAENILNMFKDGEGIFYGPFMELGMRNIALGVAFNCSYYYTNYGNTITKMIDYDLNGYLQGHLLSYRAFIDPFFEVGFGQISTDYAENEEDPDTSSPLRATKYFQAGGGLGLNFGKLGFLVKALYMIPADEPVYDNSGYYTLEDYPLKPLKVFMGAKIIL